MTPLSFQRFLLGFLPQGRQETSLNDLMYVYMTCVCDHSLVVVKPKCTEAIQHCSAISTPLTVNSHNMSISYLNHFLLGGLGVTREALRSSTVIYGSLKCFSCGQTYIDLTIYNSVNIRMQGKIQPQATISVLVFV